MSFAGFIMMGPECQCESSSDIVSSSGRCCAGQSPVGKTVHILKTWPGFPPDIWHPLGDPGGSCETTVEIEHNIGSFDDWSAVKTGTLFDCTCQFSCGIFGAKAIFAYPAPGPFNGLCTADLEILSCEPFHAIARCDFGPDASPTLEITE